MYRETYQTQALYERAKEVMPYGVSSNFRYWGEQETPVIVRGQGPYVYDADGNRYIDYRLAFGPVILGHGYPAICDRVASAIRDGVLFAATQPWEIRVAERIIAMCPGVEKVRFANSGTEATMHALRIARGYTNREKVIKFEGAYHGFQDYLLFSTASAVVRMMGSRRSPISAPVTSGIPLALNSLVYCLPFNDPERLTETVEAHWWEIAAIIVEPIMGNCLSIEPEPGFLQQIRSLCDEFGIVMIMDEVKTGFRIARGGAQEYYGVKADLATYAKAMGNGFPVAAIGGRKEVMGVIEPKALAHGGTYCGNVAGTAAADATLEMLQNQDILDVIERRGRRLQAGLSRILSEAAIEHHILGPGAMFGIHFGRNKPKDFRQARQEGDAALYERILMAAYERGIMPDPDCREPWFLCYQLSEADVDETLNIFEDSVQSVLRQKQVV